MEVKKGRPLRTELSPENANAPETNKVDRNVVYRKMTKIAEDFQKLGAKGKNFRVKQIQFLTQLVEKFPNHLRDISDFRYDRRIGRGGFGEVWLGNDRRTGKVVAIKELHPEKLDTHGLSHFCREINVMCQVDSPFVVPFVGYTIEPPYVIITEFMENGCLYKFTNKAHRTFLLSGTHRSIMALCIAHGMAAIHASGIIHRDLKCSNILLDSNRLPRIGDFGISKHDIRHKRRMSPGVGTFSHMAPEVMTSSTYTNTCDVYSYGMVLYEMSQGRSPFRDIQPQRDLMHIIPAGNRPEILRKKTPKPLVELMQRCWHQNPAQRPTWEEIFELWRTGKVAFLDTDPKVVLEFANKIAPTLKRTGEVKKDDLEVGGEPCVNVAMVRKRLKTRLQKILETVDEDGNDIEVPEVTKRVTREPVDAPLSDMPQSDDFDMEPDTGEKALKYPNSPLFDKALDYFAEVIQPCHFKALYSSLYQYFLNNKVGDIILKKIMNTFIKLAKKDKTYLVMLSELKFYSIIPVSKSLLNQTFELVEMIFEFAPESVNQTIKQSLAALIRERPDDVIQFFAMYVSHFGELEDPYPIVDFFIAYARLYVDRPGGAVLLQALCHLIVNYPDACANIRDNVTPIASAFCRSKDSNTVKEAVYTLLYVADSTTKIPFDAVCRILERRDLHQPMLSVLLRIGWYPPSRRLCQAIASRAVVTGKNFEVLWKFAAMSSEHASILLKNCKWMTAKTADAFVLFLTIFRYEELRGEIARTPGVPFLFTTMLSLGDPQLLAGLPSIISRIQIDSKFIESLTEATFLKMLYSQMKKLGADQSLLAGWFRMLSHLSLAGYSPDYELFMGTLARAIQHKSDAATAAIHVFAAFSRHPQLRDKLRQGSLIKYFHSIKGIASLANTASVFLQNVEC